MSKDKFAAGNAQVEEYNKNFRKSVGADNELKYIQNLDFNNVKQRQEFLAKINPAANDINSENSKIIQELLEKFELKSRNGINLTANKLISKEISDLINKLPIKNQNGFVELVESSKLQSNKQKSTSQKLKNAVLKISDKIKDAFISKKSAKTVQALPVINDFTPGDYKRATEFLKAQQEREENANAQKELNYIERANQKKQQLEDNGIKERVEKEKLSRKNSMDLEKSADLYKADAVLPLPILTEKPTKQPVEQLRKDRGEPVRIKTNTVVRPQRKSLSTLSSEKFNAMRKNTESVRGR